MATLIETDARGRATLPGASGRYLVREEPGGTLVLEPAIVMTVADQKFLMNAELQAIIVQNHAHPERLGPRRRRGAES